MKISGKRTHIKYAVWISACLIGSLARPQSVDTDTKVPVSIYLTFDDGPSEGSWHLVKMLSVDSIPVTVFLVGQHAFNYIDGNSILENFRSNPLVEIDNHSFCHANKKYKQYYTQPELVIKDVLLNEDTLRLENKILRLPGRNAWRLNGRKRNDLPDAKLAADSLAGRGYKIFGWDISWQYDSLSRSYPSACQMISRIRTLAENNRTFIPGHVVILCHDNMLIDEWVSSQIQQFIREIKASACFLFRQLREYPSDSNTDLVDKSH